MKMWNDLVSNHIFAREFLKVSVLWFLLSLLVVLLTGCGSGMVWVRGSERVTTRTPNPPYVNVQPASKDHAACLEKFETCNANRIDSACWTAYDYCMKGAGYHLEPMR